MTYSELGLPCDVKQSRQSCERQLTCLTPGVINCVDYTSRRLCFAALWYSAFLVTVEVVERQARSPAIKHCTFPFGFMILIKMLSTYPLIGLLLFCVYSSTIVSQIILPAGTSEQTVIKDSTPLAACQNAVRSSLPKGTP